MLASLVAVINRLILLSNFTMASRKKPSKAETLKMGGYKIDTQNILGKGSFGVVLSAENKQGKKVAVKAIDGGQLNLSQFAKDLQRLVKINHQNVVNVFEAYQEGNRPNIWMFMELCDCDLNKYFTTHLLRETKKLSLMVDMARGVEYLHSQNIIHRDLKPANIIISTGKAKLADFYLTKFLEEGYGTSAMTTDVGTKPFKAPEFWMRNAEGKLFYHRNVDVYAMGLTFLAMIQYEQKAMSEANQKLMPRIDTPREDSEMFQSIGALISERVRYNAFPQKILAEEKSTSASHQIRALRKLIQVMTKVKPEERIRAVGVVQELQKIQTVSRCPVRIPSS